jgi:hypothetical protein
VSALTRELLASLGFSVTHVTGTEAALGIDITQDVR